MHVFISIDGIDGVGKTTLAHKLADWFRENRGKQVTLTKEPTTDSPWAKRLREAALSTRLPLETEFDHFHKDRLWHIENKIVPALKLEHVVICDRYVDSTLAYQCNTVRMANDIYRMMRKEILIPELTFILHSNVNTCLNRIKLRGEVQTSFEKHRTLELANKIFISRKEKHYRLIESCATPEETAQLAIDQIKDHLNRTAKRRKPIAHRSITPTSSQLLFA